MRAGGVARRCAGLRSAARVVFAGHFTWTFAIIFTACRRFSCHAHPDTRIADLFVWAGTGRIAAKEAHARHAGLVRGAIRIRRALEVRVLDAERIFADVSTGAVGVGIAGIGATSVHAEVFAVGAVIACDALCVWTWGADASAAVFIVAAVFVLGAAIAAERIDTGATIRAVTVGFTGGGRGFNAGIVLADLVFCAVAISGAGAFRLAFTFETNIGAGAVAVRIACGRIILAESVMAKFARRAVVVGIAGALAGHTAAGAAALVGITVAIAAAAVFFGDALLVFAHFIASALGVAVTGVVDQIGAFIAGWDALCAVISTQI